MEWNGFSIIRVRPNRTRSTNSCHLNGSIAFYLIVGITHFHKLEVIEYARHDCVVRPVLRTRSSHSRNLADIIILAITVTESNLIFCPSLSVPSAIILSNNEIQCHLNMLSNVSWLIRIFKRCDCVIDSIDNKK